MKKIKRYLIIIFIFVVAISLVLLLSKISKNKKKLNTSDLMITEVMAKNKNTITDFDGDYSDYIEIYNPTDEIIYLKNYYLTDKANKSTKWRFPDIYIEPEEYLVVFASGKDIYDSETRECHTNFKLNDSGEAIALIKTNGIVINKVVYKKLESDEAYSLIDNNYVVTVGTPGTKNSEQTNETNEVIINEVRINPDTIELRNITDHEVDLTNYYIEDKQSNRYLFNDVKIKANSYLVLYGSDAIEIKDNKIYIGFKINNSNEILSLYKNDKLIDTFNVGKLNDGISKGRNKDNDIVIYKNITMGSSNSDKYYKGFSLVPVFSINGGYVENGTKVKLSVSDNSTIYYTTDGSKPSIKSKKYEGEITINKTMVIRTIAIKDDYIESDIESRTFIVGRKHSLPVISISSDNDGLYGSNGIFTMGSNAQGYYPYMGANFWKDIEVPISFAFYEEGNLGLSFNAGMKIFGGWSRGEAQKSMVIYLRKKYGLQEITYPFFTDNVNTFTKFIIRAGGQDFGKLKLKDAFLQEALDGMMDIDKQDYRPVVVYINGKYNGIYNIREKTDSSYVERHYKADENDIDFIEKNKGVTSGTIDNYNSLLNYVSTHDMTKDEAYDYVSNLVDLQELANYWVVETYYGQYDPMNIKFYKTKDSKWRWILFDLDQTFLTYSYTRVNWKLPFEPYAHGNGYYLNTTLMNRLYKNPKFRKLYIETFAYHLNNTFKPDRMIKILDEMVNEIKSEMPYHISRWYSESLRYSPNTIDNMDEWYSNIAFFKKQLKERHSIAIKTRKEGLGLTNEEYQKYFKN